MSSGLANLLSNEGGVFADPFASFRAASHAESADSGRCWYRGGPSAKTCRREATDKGVSRGPRRSSGRQVSRGPADPRISCGRRARSEPSDTAHTGVDPITMPPTWSRFRN